MPAVATGTCPQCKAEFAYQDMMHHLSKCPGSKAKQSKYRVAAREKRTYSGVTYHSALEMKRAKELDFLRSDGTIIEWFRQIRKPIGCEEIVSDFVVYGNWRSVHGGGTLRWPINMWVEEIKGHETEDWKRHLRWWKANGRITLVILKAARGGGWEREVITP